MTTTTTTRLAASDARVGDLTGRATTGVTTPRWWEDPDFDWDRYAAALEREFDRGWMFCPTTGARPTVHDRRLWEFPTRDRGPEGLPFYAVPADVIKFRTM